MQILLLKITELLSITLRNNRVDANFLSCLQRPTSLVHQVGLQIESIGITWELIRSANFGSRPGPTELEDLEGEPTICFVFINPPGLLKLDIQYSI